MYAPHVVTVYNISENPDTLETERNITILDGVFLDISKAENVQKSGLANADSAMLYIPFDVHAHDPFTGKNKAYIEPKRYEELADKTGYWTLRTSSDASAASCFFVKGFVVENVPYGTIRNKHDFVYDVSSVDTRDFGSQSMQHWQVGGR